MFPMPCRIPIILSHSLGHSYEWRWSLRGRLRLLFKSLPGGFQSSLIDCCRGQQLEAICFGNDLLLIRAQ
jgi:hypothetical protein